MKKKTIILIFIFLASCSYPERYKAEIVENIEITGLEIYLPERSMYVSDQMQAKALLIHPTGEKTFAENSNMEWSSDECIISVDEDGLVTALELGEGVITVSMGDLNASDTIEVEREVDFSKILLSEVFYDDIGSDSGKEFIEIYNGNDYNCGISGMMLVDGNANSSPFTFPDNSIIEPFSRVVVAKSYDDFVNRFGFPPDYSGFSYSLNNSGETVFLMISDGTVNDCVYIEGGSSDYPADAGWCSMDLPSADEGYSVYRINFEDTDTYEDWESGEPSPGE